MKKLIFVFAFIITVSSQSIKASNADSTLESRIERLEKSESLTDKIYELRHEELIKQNWIYIGIIALFGTLSVGGVVVIYYQLIKYTNRKIKEKIENIIETQTAKIVKIIKNHDEEAQIKQNSKILVIFKNNINLEFKTFMKKLEFKNVSYNIESQAKTMDTNKFDLIFFNNEDSTFTNKEIESFITPDNADQVYFILTPSNARIDLEKKHDKRVNRANSVISMYNNLMSTLIYQKILSKIPDNIV